MTAVELTLQGADVLTPDDRIVRGGELALAEGCINAEGCGRRVDLRGYLLLPGIVDLHGDGFERHLAPRRGAMKQMAEGVIAAEAELAANGITTAVLAQFHSWEGGMRAPDYAAEVFAALQEMAPQLVTDLVPQLRFETHMLDDYAGLPDLLTKWDVGYLVFNDHLPHQRLAVGRKPPRLVGQALKAGQSPDRHLSMMQQMHARRGEVPAALDLLCQQLVNMGVQLGSHDDQTGAGRRDWRQRGVRISEFPETLEAAEAARAGGDHIVLGAPNVVRGSSHNGNISAAELISLGLCDALASDYHYPSPRQAALMLARDGGLNLAAAWALVSKGPARVLGLMDRGEFTPGSRADILVLDGTSHRVAAVLSAGRFSYLSGDAAARFITV